jgi:uncharacterized coiled-coil DUF342 family protein
LCKRVGEINGIPQYVFCEEYKQLKAKRDALQERVNGLQSELDDLNERFYKMQDKHTPIAVTTSSHYSGS